VVGAGAAVVAAGAVVVGAGAGEHGRRAVRRPSRIVPIWVPRNRSFC
jgi:hypothetical protein